MRLHFALDAFYITSVITVFIRTTSSQNISYVENVHQDLLRGYNKEFRPVLNLKSAVNITLMLDVVSIKDFDEVKEKISISGVMHMHWYDERLPWDPKEYGDVWSFTASSKRFWTPPVILVNTVEDLDPINKDFFIVRLYRSGMVEFHPGGVFSATCQMDTTHYPWDTQHCTFDFVVWGYSAKEINLTTTKKAWMNFYTPNGIWDIIDSQSTIVAGVSLHVVISLQRKPSFIVVNVIFPIVFMSLLNLLVFLTPAEGGERISYCITVLLAIAVFMTLVGDNLPKTSNPMSILCFYIMGVLVISISIIFATIISLRFYFRDENEAVTPFWIRLVTILRCKCGRRKSKKQMQYIPEYDLRRQQRSQWESDVHSLGNDRENRSTTFSPYSLNNNIDVLPKVLKSGSSLRQDMNGHQINTDRTLPTEHAGQQSAITPTEVRIPDDSAITCSNVTWKDVSGTLDYIFFVFFLILNISSSTYCFLMMTGNVSA